MNKKMRILVLLQQLKEAPKSRVETMTIVRPIARISRSYTHFRLLISSTLRLTKVNMPRLPPRLSTSGPTLKSAKTHALNFAHRLSISKGKLSGSRGITLTSIATSTHTHILTRALTRRMRIRGGTEWLKTTKLVI